MKVYIDTSNYDIEDAENDLIKRRKIVIPINNFNFEKNPKLDKLKERVLDAVKMKVKVNKSAVEYVADQGYDKAYGARPLNRAIQKYIEDPITDEILSDRFKEGDTIKISYDKKNDKMVLS